MTWNEKEQMLDRLRENIADYMIEHGTIKRDRKRSNYYCCIRMIEVTFRGIDFNITQVDGMTCRIDRD